MADFIQITLECNGNKLQFGMNESRQKLEFGITALSGLEASELEISTTDNALVDGSTLDGKRIKSRPVHIEATLRDDTNNRENRQRIIKFFNPKYTGKLTANHSGTERNIEYELEGWTFVTKANIYNRLAIAVDLICPDPFLKNMDNFGRNMADFTPLFAFPWCVSWKKKVYNTPDPYKGLTLAGHTSGYRTLNKNVLLMNDGDVPCGLQIKFIAARGPVLNPKILHQGTGQFIRVKVSLQKGDTLLIDTSDRNQIIELNGVNSYQKIDRLSEPFKLEVGENYLEYDADENYTNLDVMLYYTPLYLGV